MQLYRWSHSLILLVSFVAILITSCNILSTHAKNLKKTTHTLLRENRRQVPKEAGTKGATMSASSQDSNSSSAVSGENTGKQLVEKNLKGGLPDMENINQLASNFVPGYKCRVCEDVVETFRDTNKCRGLEGLTKDDDGQEGSPRASNDLTPCKPPQNCDQFENAAQAEKCKSVRDSWRQDPVTLKEIYNSVYNQDNPHKTCMGLGMCRPTNEPDGAACEGVLMSNECRDDIFCDNSKCKSDDCVVCYWLVKTWPIFGDICTPGKPGEQQKSPPSVLSYNDYYGKVQRAEKSPALETDRDKRASPEGTTLHAECYTLWDKIIGWPRARYLITYINELGSTVKERTGAGWNANTVCKCLSLCPYNALQGPAVEQDCSADQPELLTPSVIESLFPDLSKERGNPKLLPKDIVAGKQDEIEANEWWKH